MKLVTAVRRAGAAIALAKNRGAMRPRAQGISWGGPRVKVDLALVGPGQSVAVDFEIVDLVGGGYGENGAWSRPTVQWQETERITDDPDDRGRVFWEGKPVGRVVEVVGSVVNIAYAAGCDPMAPPRCEHCGDEIGADPDKHACRQGKAV